MERIASEHWLPEVRAKAKHVSEALSTVGRVPHSSHFSRPFENGDNPFVIDREVLGEWGGELVWRPKNGKPESIQRDNVVGIESDEDGPVVLFGLAHMGLAYGYALHITSPNEEGWKSVEVARLPAEADALVRIGPNLFAASSDRRVVVFSAKRGVQGLATCEVH